MEIQRAPPSVSAQESLLPLDSKKDNNQSLCDKIVSVLKSAFNHFVYFITCCQVDLCTKEVTPTKPKPVQAPSTLEYMKTHHNGPANKLELLYPPNPDEDQKGPTYEYIDYVWYDEIDGQPSIVFHYKIAFDNGDHDQCKNIHQFNKSGDIDHIFDVGVKISKWEIYHHRDFRESFKLLDEKCNSATPTLIWPRPCLNEEEYKHIALQITATLYSNIETTIYCQNVISIEDNLTVRLTKEENKNFFFHFSGPSLRGGEPMTLKVEISAEDGLSIKFWKNNKIIPANLAPEWILWRDVLVRNLPIQ